ncbi:MAG: Crp/Fnr family transcriptional regulator, partial [Aeromonas sobria]
MMTDRPPFSWEQVTEEQEATRLLSFARSLTLAPRSCLWHAGDSPDLLVRV